MLKYKETNWKYNEGFKIHTYGVSVKKIVASATRKEQQGRLEKVSLVAFLDKEQKTPFANICRRLKKINKNFYQNRNLHVTVFGFGPLTKHDYQMIQKRLQKFFTAKRDFKLTINLDSIRPGTTYVGNQTLMPVQGISNGTVIAFGDVVKNETFFNFSNQLAKFLLKNNSVRSILGTKFRKKFPVVWCTLGYFNTDEFQVNGELLKFFIQYADLNPNASSFSIREISLVKSKYKNLRYPKIIHRYNN